MTIEDEWAGGVRSQDFAYPDVDNSHITSYFNEILLEMHTVNEK